MSKTSNKFGKYLLYALGIVFILYSCLWLLVSMKITNGINSNFAGKPININDTNSIKFSRASFHGFPFRIEVSIHDLIEQSPGTLIHHESDFNIGYSFLNGSLYTRYEGKSTAHSLPIESGFGADIEGKYYITAEIPMRASLLRSIITGLNLSHILYQIKSLDVVAQGVKARDKVDNSLIVDESNTEFALKINHHRSYNSMEDFKTDIPRSINLKLKTSSKDTSAVFRKPLPFSIVYGTHLGSNKGYETDMDFHTDAHILDPKEIYSRLSVKAHKINFYDSYLESRGGFEFKQVPSENSDRIASFKYNSEISIKDSFVKDIDENIKSIIKNIPKNSQAYYFVTLANKYDITKLRIDTKTVPLKVSVDSKIIAGADKKNIIDIEKLTISYADKSADLKLRVTNDVKGDPISGVIQTQNLADIAEYFVSNYRAMIKYPDQELSDDFWASFYVGYIETIANSVNREADNVLLEFNITNDIPKSRLGKYDLAQGRIVYYRTLLKHLETYYQSRDEAIKYLRSNAPAYIKEPKIFEKITGVK